MESLLIAGSMYNLMFALFHMMFWRIFNWKSELSHLNFMNRAIMQVLNLCLTFCFLTFSYVSWRHASELLTTPLGHTVLAGIAAFWFLRAIEQIVFFKLKHWGSILFLLAFVCGTVIYAIPVFT